MVTGSYNLCYQAAEHMAIIARKSTYFESSYLHLLKVHADTDEYLADDFSMAYSLCWKLSKYI